MSATPRTPRAAAVLVLGATVLFSAVFYLLHVPSAVLFGSLLGGMAHALTSPTHLQVPPIAFRLGQALIGVTIGSLVSLSSLATMGSALLPILAVTIGTIVISLAAGRLLALRDDVSQVTGAFALIAGGASGVVAIARDLGADDRVVTVVQYLRVLAVLVAMPVVTALVFDPEHGLGQFEQGSAPLVDELGFVAVALALGLVVARVVPITTATLLAPLAVAAVLGALGWFGDASVPTALQWLGYALIGGQVGLRFTRASLTSITRMLPAVLALIVGMVALTALMGGLLAWLTPVDGLTAYLATTPGGLFAVLATAADSGSDVTYVMAVQLFRLEDPVDLSVPGVHRALAEDEARNAQILTDVRPLTAATASRICSELHGREMAVRAVPGTRIAHPITREIVYAPPEGAHLIREKLSEWEVDDTQDRSHPHVSGGHCRTRSCCHPGGTGPTIPGPPVRAAVLPYQHCRRPMRHLASDRVLMAARPRGLLVSRHRSPS
jgi:membrane AbrB-like protein